MKEIPDEMGMILEDDFTENIKAIKTNVEGQNTIPLLHYLKIKVTILKDLET